MTTTRTVLALLLVTGLQACSTTMTGARMDTSPKGNLVGIPINMTRPQFEVAHIPGATAKDEDSTTITVKYVADYTRRYALNIDPNWLTSSGMGLTLGPEGQLVSMNSSSSSNATAIVQTVGKIVKAAASSASFDESDPWQLLVDALEAEKKIAETTAAPMSCLDGAAFDADLVKRSDMTIADEKEKKVLGERLKLAKSIPELQEVFRHTSTTELRLLKAVRCSLEKKLTDGLTVLVKNQADALQTVPGDQQAAARALADAATDPDKNAIARSSALARLRNLVGSGTGAGKEYARTTADVANWAPDPVLELAEKLVDMSVPEWQRRRVVGAQALADRLTGELLLLRCDGSTAMAVPVRNRMRATPAAACAGLSLRRAAALEDVAAAVGRLTEFRLATRLDAQLAAQASQKGGVDPKTYQQLRTASNQAKNDVAAARSAILKTADPVAPTALTRKEVLTLQAPPGTSPNSQWVLDQAASTLHGAQVVPDFVIVFSKEQAK